MDLLLRLALPLSVNLNCYATKVATHMKLFVRKRERKKKWKRMSGQITWRIVLTKKMRGQSLKDRIACLSLPVPPPDLDVLPPATVRCYL